MKKFSDYPIGTKLSELPQSLQDLNKKCASFAKSEVKRIAESNGEDYSEVMYDQEYIELYFAKYEECAGEAYPNHLNWNS